MITQTVNKFITTKNLDKTKIRLLTMGIHHECQHQELLVYDLQHLLAAKYKPVKKHTRTRHKPVKTKPIKIDGGLYTMGYNGSDYCYDIELPEHKVYLNEYNIDSHPVTNAQYMEFIKDGGYENYTFWLSDGWEKVKENGWRAPMYWKETKGGWITNSFLGNVINPNEPVCHVSYYEADAYCKWAGRRLPTEAEWEKAACWNEKKQEKTTFPWGNDPPTEKRCNLLESYVWGRADISSYPKGVRHYGCQEMIGNVWEWTSSEFAGYPGFESGFDEYNDKWFTGQKVLRGGSFGTPMISIRASYRNFFRLDERWMFSGFRCAGD